MPRGRSDKPAESAARLPRAKLVLPAAVLGGMATDCPSAAKGAETKVLGLDKVIAFTCSPTKDFDAKQLRRVTFIGPTKPGDWQYWATPSRPVPSDASPSPAALDRFLVCHSLGYPDKGQQGIMESPSSGNSHRPLLQPA